MFTLILHLIATSAYCTLLWLVQVLVYPQFQRVPEGAFADYHRDHCQRIGWMVGPTVLAEGVTALLVAIQFFSTQPVLQTLSLGTFILGSLLTGLIFVPLHRHLEAEGRDPVRIQRLIRMNWLRTAVGTLRLSLVLAMVFMVL
jgi:hypothetical protein